MCAPQLNFLPIFVDRNGGAECDEAQGALTRGMLANERAAAASFREPNDFEVDVVLVGALAKRWGRREIKV